jgi:hypothetical protein
VDRRAPGLFDVVDRVPVERGADRVSIRTPVTVPGLRARVEDERSCRWRSSGECALRSVEIVRRENEAVEVVAVLDRTRG